MIKWIAAAVVLVLIGIGVTVWQVIRTGRDLAQTKSVRRPVTPVTKENLKPLQTLLDQRESKPDDRLSEPPPVVPPPPDKLRSFRMTQARDLQRPRTTGKLLREGSEINDVVGTIRAAAGRYEFVPRDGNAPLILLENQLLQRVLYVQSQSVDLGTIIWRVDGTITEFRGLNFLLLKVASLAEGG